MHLKEEQFFFLSCIPFHSLKPTNTFLFLHKLAWLGEWDFYSEEAYTRIINLFISDLILPFPQQLGLSENINTNEKMLYNVNLEFWNGIYFSQLNYNFILYFILDQSMKQIAKCKGIHKNIKRILLCILWRNALLFPPL